MHRALIVDDEPTQLRLLENVVSRAGFTVETASGGQEALDRLFDAAAPTIDVMLLDIMMPEVDGLDVLRRMRPKLPQLPVVVLTSQSSILTVVEAMRTGANDFLVKPASAERIRSAMTAAIKSDELVGEIEHVSTEMQNTGFSGLVGTSETMVSVMELARKGARTNIPILIEGESGVGKEMFARAIQQASDRADKPLVTVNCGAIPENLVESILFGHEKGSFTGAVDRHIGKFEEANGGTLFLDEVGELPLDMQVKLLRAIQEGEIDPIGSRVPVSVDIRIISATNRKMEEQISEGAFREDLYYRLNVFPIYVPPLRERISDIPALANHFVTKITKMEGIGPKTIAAAAMHFLQAYNWPGNIRQLQNALFRAIILSDDDELGPASFQHLSESMRAEITAHHSPDLEKIETPAQADLDTSGVGLINMYDGDGQMRTLAEIEKEAISLALKHVEGRMSEAARRLGIGRSTLYRKIAEYGLEG